MSDGPLDAAAIERYLGDLAGELALRGLERTAIIVGGALLALHGLRAATRDVDSVVRIDAELEDAVAVVAQRNDLARKWLNDSAAAFLPATFDPGECVVLIDNRSLQVLGAPFDQVFLMKLHASRAMDTPDLAAIWPRCSFVSPEAAADAFHEGYPHEEHDARLAEHIRAII